MKAIYAIEGVVDTGSISGCTAKMENTSVVWDEENDDDHPDGILASCRCFGRFKTCLWLWWKSRKVAE